jgi:hypothetical protein
MINDTIFDNLFVDQHRFDYSEPSDNEDDDTLDPNMTVNINEDVNNDVDDKFIPLVPEFEDVYGYSFVVSHDWTLSHRRIPGRLDYN